MISEWNLGLFLTALGINGLLAGASITKSVVELPAGKRIGSLAFATYSRAADLRNGKAWFSFLGIAGPILTITVAGAMNLYGPSGAFSTTLDVAAAVSVAHIGSTMGAASNMLKVGRAGDDVSQLDDLYARFRKWNALRALLQGFTLWVCLLAVQELVFG